MILAEVKVGMRSTRTPVRMDFEQHMGALYPFSLAQKLARITEPSTFYGGGDHGWRRPLVPMEMISVLMQYSARENSFKTRGPAVGLFADQEIRLLQGPVLAGEPYDIEREVVALSGESPHRKRLGAPPCTRRARSEKWPPCSSTSRP